MAPRSQKRAKESTIPSKNVVLEPEGLVGMPMDIIFEVRQILKHLLSVNVQPAT